MPLWCRIIQIIRYELIVVCRIKPIRMKTDLLTAKFRISGFRLGLLSLATAGLCVSSGAQAEPIRNERTAAAVFLRPVAGAAPTRPGPFTTFRLSIANELRSTPSTFEDAETWRLRVLHGARNTRGQFWWIEMPLVSRYGGLLDPLIDAWHRAFVDDGVPLRRTRGYGESLLDLPGAGRVRSGLGWGDLTFATGQTWGPWQGSAYLKVPTGDPAALMGSGTWDAALAAEYLSPVWGRARFWAKSSLTWIGPGGRLERVRRRVPHHTLGLQYDFGPGTAFAQWDAEPAPQDLPDIASDPHRIITFGWRWQKGDWSYSAWMSQDGDWGPISFPGGARIGPDMTLGLRVQRRF